MRSTLFVEPGAFDQLTAGSIERSAPRHHSVSRRIVHFDQNATRLRLRSRDQPSTRRHARGEQIAVGRFGLLSRRHARFPNTALSQRRQLSGWNSKIRRHPAGRSTDLFGRSRVGRARPAEIDLAASGKDARHQQAGPQLRYDFHATSHAITAPRAASLALFSLRSRSVWRFSLDFRLGARCGTRRTGGGLRRSRAFGYLGIAQPLDLDRLVDQRARDFAA